MILHITRVYRDSKGIQHTKNSMMFREDCNFTNIDQIKDFSSVNNVVVENNFILQASGYNPERGLFIDTYGFTEE